MCWICTSPSCPQQGRRVFALLASCSTPAEKADAHLPFACFAAVPCRAGFFFGGGGGGALHIYVCVRHPPTIPEEANHKQPVHISAVFIFGPVSPKRSPKQCLTFFFVNLFIRVVVSCCA